MTQYLQNGLKDFKNILYTNSLWYKDVLRQFWFRSEKITFFSKIFTVVKWDQTVPREATVPPPPLAVHVVYGWPQTQKLFPGTQKSETLPAPKYAQNGRIFTPARIVELE